MNTNNKLIIGGIVVFLIVTWFIIGQSDGVTSDVAITTESGAMMEETGDAMMESEEAVIMEGEAMEAEKMMESDAMMEEPHAGTYEPYSPEKVSGATGKTVLFFKASWCPSCRNAHDNFTTNKETIPGDLTILEVDYDDSADLKKKYGVTSQHSFVQVDSEGNMIKKWLGSDTVEKVVAELQ